MLLVEQVVEALQRLHLVLYTDEGKKRVKRKRQREE